MYITLLAIFFLFGLVLGSFFNVVGLRVPKKEPFINDRSHCPACNHTLQWYELIPVASYIFLWGKCSQCNKRISIMYPVVEISTGFLFAFSFAMNGYNLELLTPLTLVSMLMIILVSDIHYMLIPNKILLFFLPIFILVRIIQPLDPWWDTLAGGIAAVVLLSIIIIVSKGGMGGGDMKLFGLLGIILGLEKVLLAFFLSTLIGALIGGGLLLFKVIGRKQEVPFGPYIIVSALISFFYGEQMIDWYFNYLL